MTNYIQYGSVEAVTDRLYLTDIFLRACYDFLGRITGVELHDQHSRKRIIFNQSRPDCVTTSVLLSMETSNSRPGSLRDSLRVLDANHTIEPHENWRVGQILS